MLVFCILFLLAFLGAFAALLLDGIAQGDSGVARLAQAINEWIRDRLWVPTRDWVNDRASDAALRIKGEPNPNRDKRQHH